MIDSKAGYEKVLDTSLSTMESEWSKEDGKLRDWLSDVPTEEFHSILEILKERWFNDVCTDNFLGEISARYPNDLTDLDRFIGATLVVHELREYGGRTGPWNKPPYEKILTKVHKRIGKRFKKPVPEVATVRAREEAIASILVGEAINDLSAEDLDSALKGMDLDPSLLHEKRKELITQTLAGAGMQGLIRLFGKNVLKKAIMAVLEKFLQKKIAEKGLTEILKRIATKIPAEAVKRAFFWISIALLIKDAWDLSGEATRITTPLVTTIAISRTIQTLTAEEKKQKPGKSRVASNQTSGFAQN